MRLPPAKFRIEQLPKWLLCIPLILHWFWLGVRWRSLTLPSAANPGIEGGGLAGESKAACLALIGQRFMPYVAAWHRVFPGDNPAASRIAAGLSYPLIAKPDIGWCGYGVRLLEDDAKLAAYAAAFPVNAAFILQRYMADPGEAGLFYLRWPGARHGRLLSVTLRHPPSVTGDAIRTLAELLNADPVLSRYASNLSIARLARCPALGECVPITTIASLRVGATYEDASAHATPRLVARVDAIARSMDGFHFGRFDVRFTSLAALQRGHFSIIEVNGAGSEAIQFWDPAIPIVTAFAGVFAKTALLFRLGDAMRRRGHRPMGIVALSRAWLRQRRLIGRYPPSN